MKRGTFIFIDIYSILFINIYNYSCILGAFPLVFVLNTMKISRGIYGFILHFIY